MSLPTFKIFSQLSFYDETDAIIIPKLRAIPDILNQKSMAMNTKLIPLKKPKIFHI